MGFAVIDLDRADAALGDVADPVQHGQQPAGLRGVFMTNRERKPDAALKIVAPRTTAFPVTTFTGPALATAATAAVIAIFAAAGRCVVVQVFRCRLSGAVLTDKSSCDLFGRMTGQNFGHKSLFIVLDRIDQNRVFEQTRIITLGNFLDRGRVCPLGIDMGIVEQPLGTLAPVMRHDQDTGSLAPCPARPPAAMQQRLAVFGQIGVDHQFKIRQIEPTCRNVGRDTHPRPAVPHCLQGMGSLGLAQLARQRHHRETTIGKTAGHPVNAHPRCTEHDGAFRFVIAQYVDDRVFTLVIGNIQRPVFDIYMLLLFGGRFHADCVVLVLLREVRDHPRNGRGEHHGAAFGRRGIQNEFKVFAEAEIEHLIGFIQYDGLQGAHIERPAFDVITQTTWRADDNMDAPPENLSLRAHIHATDAGRKGSPGLGIEPFELAHNLKCEFARGRYQERARCLGVMKPFRLTQQGRRQCKTESHRLAGTRLRRYRHVGIPQFGGQNLLLNRGQCLIVTVGQRCAERRHDTFEVGHHFIFRNTGLVGPVIGSVCQRLGHT